MRSKKQLLRIWKIYAVLDASLFPDTGKLLRKFKALLDSPVDAIQLRFKDFTDLSLYRAAEKMAALSKARHVPLIINDRPEIALSLGASGVHLGKSDISISAARRLRRQRHNRMHDQRTGGPGLPYKKKCRLRFCGAVFPHAFKTGA